MFQGVMPDTSAVIEAMPGRKLPGVVNAVAIAGIAWGVLALVYGFFIAQDPAWTWGAYIVALVYTLAMAQGGVLFGVMMTLTQGRWGVPVKRVAESFGFFLPIGYVLLLVLLVAGQGLYPWNPNTWVEGGPVDLAPHSPAAMAAKELYLTWGFWFARQAISVGVLIALDFMYLRWSLRPDMIKASAHLKAKDPSWTAPGWWSWFMGNPGSLEAEVEVADNRRNLYGAMVAVAYPFVFSFMTFDLIMSLVPWWFANMFGAWFMVSSFWIGLCATGIVAFAGRDWLGIKSFVTPAIGHDLGKLALALSMFWAYTTYAQILPIWYANMPEETDFLLIRLNLPQWSWLARTVAVLCFLTPFTSLLSRGLKKMKGPFIVILSIILVGLFLERTLQVMPSVYMGDTFPTMNFLIISCGMLAGFMGLFISVVGRVLASAPPMAISDPTLAPHPWDEHVHSLDHAHH